MWLPNAVASHLARASRTLEKSIAPRLQTLDDPLHVHELAVIWLEREVNRDAAHDEGRHGGAHQPSPSLPPRRREQNETRKLVRVDE